MSQYIDYTQRKVFEKLARYSPILTGTIPIGLDLPDSDLDIICQCDDHLEFTRLLTELFSSQDDFRIETTPGNGSAVTLATFKVEGFDIEIFGQDIPTRKQKAYRHMLIEQEILREKGSEFRTEILKLKQEGLKTEPAFAKLLGIKGDPYEELLNYSS